MADEIKNRLDTGLKYHQAGRFPEAEVIYRGVLLDDPDNPNALNLFGVLLYQLKKYDEAIEKIKRAIEVEPSSYYYKNLGNIYLDKNELEEAVMNYKQALVLDPEDMSLYFSIGLSYKKMNDTDQAIAYYEKALELKPDLSEAYYNLGNIYKDKNDLETAKEYYQKAVDLKPEYAKSLRDFGF